MWVNKHIWAQVKDLVSSQANEIQSLRRQLEQRDRLVADRDTTIAVQARELMGKATEIGQQQERHSSLQFKLELLLTRLNQIQTERDQFLTKLVPELKISTPHIGYEPIVVPPGTTFEDMGDEAAAVHGLLPDPVPLGPEELGGLVGEVLDAARIKASS